jgi:hypothetical protein
MSTRTPLRQAALALALLCLPLSALLANGPSPADSLAYWARPFVETSQADFAQLEREYLDQTEPLRHRLQDVCSALADPRNRTPECGFQLLWERTQLQETLWGLQQEHELKLIKLRYRKSIEIVKMLYEKVLSMDHHLSSLKAQQGMASLSNPHNYPEFKEARNLIEERMKKKSNFQMPALFQTNPFLSAAFSIVGMAIGGADDKDKRRASKR